MPTWPNTRRGSATSAFFFGFGGAEPPRPPSKDPMAKTRIDSCTADRRGGHRLRATANGTRARPGDRGSRSGHVSDQPARGALAGGAGLGPEPGRCVAAAGTLPPAPPTRCGIEIKRMKGMKVREAHAVVETTTGGVIQWFATGSVVQLFLHAGNVSADT